MPQTPLFTVITPSRGDRPNALANAVASVGRAAAAADLPPSAVEMLIGYDGVKGPRIHGYDFATFFDLPYDGNFGNAIRNTLLKAAKGTHILLLDDDNEFTPEAFITYMKGLEHDMQIARIDVSRAFDIPTLPRPGTKDSIIRQGNIDPLCLCMTRELMIVRCDGWGGKGGYESDYINILRYWRRAASVLVHDAVVGIYDAGAGLDENGMNQRQQASTVPPHMRDKE